MEDLIGTASAATLGFITGNIKGARSAVQSYQHIRKRQRMYSSPTAQNSEAGGSTHTSTARGRTKRRTSDMSTSRSRGGSVVRFKAKGETTQRVSAVRKRGNKVKKEGKKKKVKVSSLFKQKVSASLEKDMIKGTYVETLYSYYTLIDTIQAVNTLGNGTSVGQLTLGDPVRILDAASVLWNSKTPIQNKTATDVGNFQYEGFKVHVESCYTTFLIKNNTANSVTITLIDFSPKTIFDGAGVDFVNNWVSALALFGPSAAGTQTTTINPLANTVNEFGIRPNFCPSMTKQYSMDYTTIVLEPGKEHLHKLPLYNNKTLDFAKFDQNGVFANQQKFVKGCVMIHHGELTATAASNPGRFTDITAPSAYSLLVEQKNYYNLRLPEQAGFVYPNVAPVAGQNIALYKRARAFAFKNWGNAQGAPAVANVDDDNPQAPTTVGTT